MIVEELTVTKVMLSRPVPSPAVIVETPETKIDPAPEVSNVIVESVDSCSTSREVEGTSCTQRGVNCDGQTSTSTRDICRSEATSEVQLVITISVTEVEGGSGSASQARSEVEGVIATHQRSWNWLRHHQQSRWNRCQHHQR